MITRISKWSAIAVLIGGLFWHPLGAYGTLLQFVVSAAAIVVLVQAAGAHRYVWMSLFLLAACLFNPIVPLELSHRSFRAASILTVLLFFFSIELLQPKARLSNASMTGRRPGSKSLGRSHHARVSRPLVLGVRILDSTSKFHTSGIHFENAYESDDLAHNL